MLLCFQGDCGDKDRHEALQTLFSVIFSMTRLMVGYAISPLPLPFFTISCNWINVNFRKHYFNIYGVRIKKGQNINNWIFLCTIPALLIHSWGDGSNGDGFDDLLQASFTPFITEHNYQALRPYIPESMNSEETQSIHYLMIPQAR